MRDASAQSSSRRQLNLLLDSPSNHHSIPLSGMRLMMTTNRDTYCQTGPLSVIVIP